MKKYIILLLVFAGCLSGCEKIDIGFLTAGNAYYRPDSMLIKHTLNPDDPEDKYIIDNEIPWTGSEISNVQGTPVIRYEVFAVYDSLGKSLPSGIVRQFSTIGKGSVSIANDHTLPVGKYVLDIRIYNKDHSYMLEKGFTVIVIDDVTTPDNELKE